MAWNNPPIWKFDYLHRQNLGKETRLNHIIWMNSVVTILSLIIEFAQTFHNRRFLTELSALDMLIFSALQLEKHPWVKLYWQIGRFLTNMHMFLLFPICPSLTNLTHKFYMISTKKMKSMILYIWLHI